MVKIKIYINILMTWFDYVYYRTYIAYQKRKESAPEIYAAGIVSIAQLCSAFMIDALLQCIMSISIFTNMKKSILFIIALIIMSLNERRYKKINFKILHKRWRDEPKKLRRKRGCWVLIYILAMVLFPVIYGLIVHNIIGGKSFF
jgi:hypothetical protein